MKIYLQPTKTFKGLTVSFLTIWTCCTCNLPCTSALLLLTISSITQSELLYMDGLFWSVALLQRIYLFPVCVIAVQDKVR